LQKNCKILIFYSFHHKGEVDLKIERTIISNQESLYITVRDSGIGIKKEDIPKLFKLFGKLEQCNNEINTSGVGLGLTISQNLVCLLSNKQSEK
jgi:signal transduction histidine kinase